MFLIDRCVGVAGRTSVISGQRGAIRSVRDREDAIVRNKSARTAKPPDRRVQRTRKLLPQEVDDIFRGLVMPGLATELELRPKAS